MSESGEDARLQRFIERERMGLTDKAKARSRELDAGISPDQVTVNRADLEAALSNTPASLAAYKRLRATLKGGDE